MGEELVWQNGMHRAPMLLLLYGKYSRHTEDVFLER